MKKGFSLVEIMVVIVILGVLAAIGVPKLFGQIAKAKASEVAPAAGTYIKLQDAYQGEKTIIGNWKNIGYEAPGTSGVSKEFRYGGCVENDAPVTDEDLTVIGWKATNRNNLNLCGVNQGTWAVQVSAISGQGLNYANLVSSHDCGVLTGNWTIANISDECGGAQQQASNNPEPQQQPEQNQQPQEQQQQPEQNQQTEELTDSQEQQDSGEDESTEDTCPGTNTSCSNASQCSLGGGATNNGKEKKLDCSKKNFKNCCACCGK